MKEEVTIHCKGEEMEAQRVYCENKATSTSHLYCAFWFIRHIHSAFSYNPHPQLWEVNRFQFNSGLNRSPTSLRASAMFTENLGFKIPLSAPGTYSVKHPVQQSGDHGEDGGLKGLEIVHKQPDISLEKSYFSSMTEHHTLER